MIAIGGTNIVKAYLGSTELANIAIGDELLLGSVELPRAVAVYNVTSTSSATRLLYSANYTAQFVKMLVDSTPMPVSSNYTFDTLGEHSVGFLTSGTEISGTTFRACVNMQSLTVPEGITSIGTYFCYQDTALIVVDLPSSMLTIGSQAFSGCTALATFIVRASAPPTLGAKVFNSVSSNMLIYVPDDSVDTYKTSWSSHSGKIRALSTLT